jgi:hypothetical protein
MFNSLFNDTHQNIQTNFSLQVLCNNRDFQLLMHVINEELNFLRIQTDTMRDTELLWQQGKCQALQEILKLPDRVQNYVNTVKNTQKR